MYNLLPSFILLNNRLKLVTLMTKQFYHVLSFSQLNYPLNSIPTGIFGNFVRLGGELNARALFLLISRQLLTL